MLMLLITDGTNDIDVDVGFKKKCIINLNTFNITNITFILMITVEFDPPQCVVAQDVALGEDLCLYYQDVRMPRLSRQAGAKLWKLRKICKNHGKPWKTSSFPRK